MANPPSSNGRRPTSGRALRRVLGQFSIGDLPQELVAPATPSQSSDAFTSAPVPEIIDASFQSTRPDADAEPLTPEAYEAAKFEYEAH
ncbi:hypothetical protein PENSPDRAFT_694884 [Peniophora sp. CONT]|nr:hypothetical protein PENSPDRAFT_694884 [Peniophora sp. CONT]